MNHTRTILALTFLLCGLAGCAGISSVTKSKAWSGDAESKRSLLVGKWLGVAPLKDGGLRRWTNHRLADGTYVIVVRNLGVDGEVEENIEYGDWGVSGDVYFTVMRGWIRDGRRVAAVTRYAYYDDAYRIRLLENDRFEYVSVTSGRRYLVVRVSDDFSLENQPNLAPQRTPGKRRFLRRSLRPVATDLRRPAKYTRETQLLYAYSKDRNYQTLVRFS